ncbi:unnamed protein product [Caenorhabditis brenneri]
MLRCVKNETVFQRLDNYNLFDVQFHLALVSEINNVLACSETVTCNVSLAFRNYTILQKHILDLFDKALQTRLTKDILDEIVNTCMPLHRPAHNHPCRTEDYDKCLVQEAAKQPNWVEEDVSNFHKLILFFNMKCVMYYEDGLLVREYIDAVRNSL